MRRVAVVIALLAVFVVTARIVWLRGAIRAYGYEIRNLRQREAELENDNALLEADVARWSTESKLRENAERLGLHDLAGAVPATLIMRPEEGAVDGAGY